MTENLNNDLANSTAPNKKRMPGWCKQLIFWLAAVIVLLATFIGCSYQDGAWDFGKGAELAFKTVLVDNFLGITPLLLGIITFAGYLALKRGFVQSFLGFLKTAIGVIVMTTGSGVIVNMAKPIFQRFSYILGGGTKVISLDPYLGFTSAQGFLGDVSGNFGSFAVSAISFGMILALVVNVLLVLGKKGTNLRGVMITGHIMFQQAAVFTAMSFLFMVAWLSSVGVSIDLSRAETFYPITVATIFITGITLGLYWATSTSAAAKGTDKVTGNAGFTVGHQQMIGTCIASKLGKYFGDPNDSAEHRKLPKSLKIFEDNIFTQFIIVFVLFFILIMIIQFAPLPNELPDGKIPVDADVRFSWTEINKKGQEEIKILADWQVAKGAHWSINMILGPFKFIGGLIVLTTGVRMFVTELQQSFQGIVDKLLKDGIVAVDIAATYGFAPNSVTYGFLSGTIAQFIAMGITIGLSFIPGSNIPMIVPLFITLFFNSGAMGVFANATGGWKAAIIVPAIMGFVGILSAMGVGAVLQQTFNPMVEDGGVLTTVVDSAGNVAKVNSPIETGYMGMFDWNVAFGLVFMIMGIPSVGFPLALLLLWAAFLVWGQFITYTDGHEGPLYKKFFGKKNQEKANVQTTTDEASSVNVEEKVVAEDDIVINEEVNTTKTTQKTSAKKTTGSKKPSSSKNKK